MQMCTKPRMSSINTLLHIYLTTAMQRYATSRNIWEHISGLIPSVKRPENISVCHSFPPMQVHSCKQSIVVILKCYTLPPCQHRDPSILQAICGIGYDFSALGCLLFCCIVSCYASSCTVLVLGKCSFVEVVPLASRTKYVWCNKINGGTMQVHCCLDLNL